MRFQNQIEKKLLAYFLWFVGLLIAPIENLAIEDENILQVTASPIDEANNSEDFDGWDLNILREIALRNSPRILVKRAEYESFIKNVDVVQGQYFPSLKARMGFNDYKKIAQSQTYSEPNPYGLYDYGLDARWTLYNGYKTRKQIKTAELEVLKAEKSLHLEEKLVLRELALRYFEILSANIESRFIPLIEDVRKKRKEIYEKQVKAGLTDRMMLNFVAKELEAIQIKRMHSEASLEIAKSEIEYLLNLKEDTLGESSKFIIPDALILAKDINPAKSTLAELGQLEIQIAKSRVNEIKSEKSPTIEFIGSSGYRERNRLDMDKRAQEFTLGIKIEIPLFDYFLTERKLGKAGKEVERSKRQHVRMINQYRSQMLAEEKRLDLAQKNYSYHKELLVLQEKRVTATKKIVEQGVVDIATALQEEEELMNRKMLVEQSMINTLKHQYLIDLIK